MTQLLFGVMSMPCRTSENLQKFCLVLTSSLNSLCFPWNILDVVRVYIFFVLKEAAITAQT